MARTQPVFPPDAGSANAGNVPSISNCGRGITRRGDTRKIGDVVSPGQTGVWTPGTIGFNTVLPKKDSEAIALGTTGEFGNDGESAPQANGGSFDGFSGAGEGFDAFSSKQGKVN